MLGTQLLKLFILTKEILDMFLLYFHLFDITWEVLLTIRKASKT